MKKKYFLPIFFMLFLILFFHSLKIENINVFAIENGYSFETTNITVQLNEDGSADVFEEWIIDYKEGTFSRFYKNINLNVSKKEEFVIGNWSIKVDNVECKYTDDTTNRPDYHYSIIKDGSVLRYEVYAKSENQTRTYKIHYTLYDVVKYINNKYYLFSYQFLSGDYKSDIVNLNINIIPPSNCKIETLYKTEGDEHLVFSSDKNVKGISIQAKNISGLFKAEIRIDDNVFNSISEKSYLRKIETIDSEDILIFLFIFIFLFILFCFFTILFNTSYEIKNKLELKKEAKNNPDILYNKVYNKINQWCPQYCTPAQFASEFADNKYLAYIVYLAELYEKNIIYLSSDYRYIYFPCFFNEDDYVEIILNVLKNCKKYFNTFKFEIKEEDGYYKLPTIYLANYFEIPSVYQEVSIAINKCKSIYSYEMIKDIKYISYAIKHLPLSDILDFEYIEFEHLIYDYKNTLNTILFAKNYKSENYIKDIKFNSYKFRSMAITGYSNFIEDERIKNMEMAAKSGGIPIFIKGKYICSISFGGGSSSGGSFSSSSSSSDSSSGGGGVD